MATDPRVEAESPTLTGEHTITGAGTLRRKHVARHDSREKPEQQSASILAPHTTEDPAHATCRGPSQTASVHDVLP
ncbi:hypothetical protein GCM10020221_26800 [Streptomyces thioluteus]|uniref:Uncharacterized protein n=1 Tax=Streptomyces thioluteus TaxID=66431 RepID=A0ABN3WWN6_STRTU